MLSYARRTRQMTVNHPQRRRVLQHRSIFSPYQWITLRLTPPDADLGSVTRLQTAASNVIGRGQDRLSANHRE